MIGLLSWVPCQQNNGPQKNSKPGPVRARLNNISNILRYVHGEQSCDLQLPHNNGKCG